MTRTHFQKLVDEMEKGLDAALISASPSRDGAEERAPGCRHRSRRRAGRAARVGPGEGRRLAGACTVLFHFVDHVSAH